MNTQTQGISLSLYALDLKLTIFSLNISRTLQEMLDTHSRRFKTNWVEVVRKYICNEIIAEVKKSKYYTVIVDEVTDISNKEQVSISLRYVYYGTVKEVFIAFVSVERITGKNIAAAILNWIQTAGLSSSDMRGQCYDGASNMSGARSGCS